jgi:hypothetical protein
MSGVFLTLLLFLVSEGKKLRHQLGHACANNKTLQVFEIALPVLPRYGNQSEKAGIVTMHKHNEAIHSQTFTPAAKAIFAYLLALLISCLDF